ncbi:MAG TPA: Mur ligase family protein, partial [Polyangiaceae bacterium]|nr:Mur ligase family protein [Polyangiaceae bacterium]
MATAIGANRAAFDARAVAEATGGRIVRGTPGRRANGVTTDSRAVVPGGAFVALRGEKHDAHGFVGAAIDAGASLVVVERGRAPDDARADAVEVDDTLAAWGAMARAHLRAWRSANGAARVVAITGSAGKTTTKELCAALLAAAGETIATVGNLNNRIGVPATALTVCT